MHKTHAVKENRKKDFLSFKTKDNKIRESIIKNDVLDAGNARPIPKNMAINNAVVNEINFFDIKNMLQHKPVSMKDDAKLGWPKFPYGLPWPLS